MSAIYMCVCVCVCVCVFCRIQTHSCTGHWADWSREREHTLGTLFVARTKCTEHMSQKALFHCRSALRYTNTGSLRGTSGGKHSRTWKTPGQTRLYFHEECERQLWTECDALRGRERDTVLQRRCILKQDLPAYLRRMYGCGCLHGLEIVRQWDNVQKEALGGGWVVQISYRLLMREK